MAAMKFWLSVIFFWTSVSAISYGARGSSNKALRMVSSDVGVFFEERILKSTSNYSNPSDNFTPSKTMTFVDSIYKKKPTISFSYREFVGVYIMSSIILTAGALVALIVLGCALFFRGLPNSVEKKQNYCRCLPKIPLDMPASEKKRRLTYYRVKWSRLLEFFLFCAFLANLLSIIGYIDLTKGELL